VTDTAGDPFPWSGGEDGWRWATDTLEGRFIIESIRPLFAAPEPAALWLTALALFAWAIRRAKVSALQLR
jgi:hypothetical protein